MPYAERTTVSVEKTKAEIDRTLTRYDADRFAYFVAPKGAVVIFEAHGQRLRFNLPLEEGAARRPNGTASSGGAPFSCAPKPSLKASPAISRPSRKLSSPMW